MRELIRCFRDMRSLWWIWVPLLALTLLLPPIVLAIPLVEKRLIDDVILARRPDRLPATIGMYAALWFLSTVAAPLGSLLRTYLSESATIAFRQRLFAHSQELSLAFSRREHSGRTMGLFVNDVPSLVGLLTSNVFSAVASVVTLLITAILMVSLSWQLAIVGGFVAPLIALATIFATRPIRPIARRAQEKAADLTMRIQDNLAGIREVVAFGRERSQGLRFASALHELLRLRMRLATIDAALQSGQSLVTLLATLAILGFGGYLVIEGRTTLGTVVAMRSLFGYVFQPATQLLGLVGGVQKALGAADRVYAFLDTMPRVQERPHARDVHQTVGTITFDRVSFSYERDRPVLEDVSLTARPGEMIALVGPSGAGKTTLVSLIPRFYDPDSGRVLLDGADLRDLTLASMRAQIGIVFQDTFLFAGTIRDNLTLGRDDADPVEIVAAARSANALEFIEQLPQGFETDVGERGAQLSEGQRQRLAIARAFLRDPRILILDEPTSSLDARSEHLIQNALDRLIRGRTTFVIAHRLTTVRRAKQILVLDGGRIVQRGTHDELLREPGLYRDLFEQQYNANRLSGPVSSRSDNAATVAS